MKTSLSKLAQAIVWAATITIPTVLFPAQPASATVVTQCDALGLSEAIKNIPIGGTINFDCPANTTINLDSEIVLTKAITLDGSGMTNLSISGQNRNRIFRTTKNLTLKNLTLTEGRVLNRVSNYSCEGGAIHISLGKLVLEDVMLKNNFAPRGGGVCGNWKAKVEISSSTFVNNTGHQGGAIFTNTSDLSIDTSEFMRNATQPGQNLLGTGGAIFTFTDLDKTTPITISNSRFDGNKSYHEGGAIFIGQNNGSNFSLSNSTLVNNEALLNTKTGIGSGGAIKLSHSGSQSLTTIANVVFANNAADQEAGALWAGGVKANLNLNLTQVTFYSNKSGRIPDPQLNETAGGGLLLATGTGKVVFDYSTFAENKSNNETGGGMWVDPAVAPANVLIKNSIFYRNCSLKDVLGTPAIENCVHLVHVNNTMGAFQDQGNQNNYEWIANYSPVRKIDRPLTANILRKDVKVRAYIDNGDAMPDHPGSDVNSGAGSFSARLARPKQNFKKKRTNLKRRQNVRPKINNKQRNSDPLQRICLQNPSLARCKNITP
jgi:hypothetical protein